jgi:endonuclease/exonuclease/phosphatase family metal-dependent hydrolase
MEPSMRYLVVGMLLMMLAGCQRSNESLATQDEFRVMTFNIRNSKAPDEENAWPHRKHSVAQAIEKGRADFVGLQEVYVDQKLFLESALPAYQWLFRTREQTIDAGEATPLLYRKDRWTVDKEEAGHFWLSDSPELPGSSSWGNEIPRMVTWARFVDKRSQLGIYVYNSHLDHQSIESRKRSTQLLMEKARGRKHQTEPVVLLGDFNADEDSEALRSIVHVSESFVDVLRTWQEASQAHGTSHGFTGTQNGKRRDYIFSASSLGIVEAQTLVEKFAGRYPSDHFPVAATLSRQ